MIVHLNGNAFIVLESLAGDGADSFRQVSLDVLCTGRVKLCLSLSTLGGKQMPRQH